MKITRRQLRSIIREATYDHLPYDMGGPWVDKDAPVGKGASRYDDLDVELTDKEIESSMGWASPPASTTMMSAGAFREEIEHGDWPGRPLSFEWDYVEQESAQDLRFDWRGGSMWYRAYSPPGEIEGNVPKHLAAHLKKMGVEVY
jgi:hypothetical protein